MNRQKLQIEKYLFTASDVHKCFPWLAGTTLFHRVKDGLLPYHSGGDGRPFEFTMAGLVHIGVIDELLFLGAWKIGFVKAEPEFEFIVHPSCKSDYEYYSQNAASDHERALAFYKTHHFQCSVIINIRHYWSTGKQLARRKRATRSFHARFVSHAEQGIDVPEPRGDVGEGPYEHFTHAIIDAKRIWLHVADTLT
jgi:hypothetical protein